MVARVTIKGGMVDVYKRQEYTAIFLSDLGDAYKKTEDYEKALENYQQALKIQESNGSDQTWSYIRIARIYNALKDYDAAKHFYGKASGSETADSYTKGVAFYNMGQMYHERGEYSPAPVSYTHLRRTQTNIKLYAVLTPRPVYPAGWIYCW